MIRRTTGCSVILALLIAACGAFAGENPLEGARVKEGIIARVSYGDRTAIISGYKYRFGVAAKVKMVGSEFGAFGMLLPNMKVLIFYKELGFVRDVVELRVLPDNVMIRRE